MIPAPIAGACKAQENGYVLLAENNNGSTLIDFTRNPHGRIQAMTHQGANFERIRMIATPHARAIAAGLMQRFAPKQVVGGQLFLADFEDVGEAADCFDIVTGQITRAGELTIGQRVTVLTMKGEYVIAGFQLNGSAVIAIVEPVVRTTLECPSYPVSLRLIAPVRDQKAAA